MTRVLLLLGGNVGNRRKTLERAIASIAALTGTRLVKRSRLYETAPVGPSRRSYLNMAVAVDTELSPMGLLIECKRLEAAAGRKAGRRWAARPLDIDIAVYGRLRSSTPWLKVPHPRLEERAFALAPLSDLDGRFAASFHRLKDGAGAVKLYR